MLNPARACDRYCLYVPDLPASMPRIGRAYLLAVHQGDTSLHLMFRRDRALAVILGMASSGLPIGKVHQTYMNMPLTDRIDTDSEPCIQTDWIETGRGTSVVSEWLVESKGLE